MGKTTLYHPISLLVIRGAAQYCGWQFGRITQARNDPTKGIAEYTCEIVLRSARAANMTNQDAQIDLQNCFMDDIKVTSLRTSKHGVWLVDLFVKVAEAD